MKKYYAVIDNEQKGPFSIEELNIKTISASTLIWTEELDDWTEAKNIEELKSIYKKTPPPLPKETEKTYKIEAEIRKKKEKLIKPETEVATAKEIRINFKMLLYAIIIGLISYPIFFALENGFSHIEMQSKWEKYHSVYFSWITASEEAKEKRTRESDELEYQSKQLGYYGESSGVLGGPSFSGAEDYHKRQYQNASKEAIWYSFITVIVAAIILIIGRYIIKGAKWVDNTSKKENLT